MHSLGDAQLGPGTVACPGFPAQVPPWAPMAGRLSVHPFMPGQGVSPGVSGHFSTSSCGMRRFVLRSMRRCGPAVHRSFQPQEATFLLHLYKAFQPGKRWEHTLTWANEQRRAGPRLEAGCLLQNVPAVLFCQLLPSFSPLFYASKRAIGKKLRWRFCWDYTSLGLLR